MAHYGPNFLFVSPFVPEAQLKVDGLRVVQKNAATCVRCLAAQVQRCRRSNMSIFRCMARNFRCNEAAHTHTHTEDFFFSVDMNIYSMNLYSCHIISWFNISLYSGLIISIGFIFHPWGHDPSDAGIVVTGLKPTSMWVSLMFWAPQICKFKMVRWQF